MSKSEEFILLRTLQPVQTGQEFNQIPPHMTDLTWFSVDSPTIDGLFPVLDTLVETQGAATRHATGIELVQFGPHENIPACRVLVGTRAIYETGLQWVDDHKGVFRYEKYARGWRPHITHEQGVTVQPHDLVLFSSLALISRQDAMSNSSKRVEYAVQLPTAGVWGDAAAWAVRS